MEECVGFFECGGLNLLDDAGGKKNKLHKSLEGRRFAMMMKKYVFWQEVTIGKKKRI